MTLLPGALVADEGVDSAIVKRLRDEGNRVAYIAELSPGVTDEAVLTLANEQDALLLTTDKDFGELVFRLGQLHTGIVLLRLFGMSGDIKAARVIAALQAHGPEMLGAFTVISSHAVRIRKRLSSG